METKFTDFIHEIDFSKISDKEKNLIINFLHSTIRKPANELPEKINSKEKVLMFASKMINDTLLRYGILSGEVILKYLLYQFEDFDKLKNLYPLKNVKEINLGEKLLEDNNIFILTGYSTDSKEYYIVNLAYKEIYDTFYSNQDYNKFHQWLRDNNYEIENFDYGSRVLMISSITQQYFNFPMNDLVYSLGLININNLINILL
jgi:hypothetical protein